MAHIVQDFDHIARGLRNPDLAQALYDEGRIIMKDVLLTLHGKAHRKRRLLEFGVFRRDFFRWYETTVFPRTLEETIGADLGSGKSELVELGYRVTMNLTADFAGIDRPDKSAEETATLLRLVSKFSEAATMVHSTRDKEELRAEVRQAITEFEPLFLQPSISRRKAMLAELDAGKLEESQLPRDVLTVILRKGSPEDFPHDMIMREMAFYLQAGAHSTANSTIHAFHDILTWYEAHPEDRDRLRDDPVFFQRCVHESLRLHPASPVSWRKSVCPVSLDGIGDVGDGELVEFRLAEANCDPEIFGADAQFFNPYREIPVGHLPFGLTFGTGVHACLGRDLDGGVVPRGDVDPQDHQYGTITLFVRRLFAEGARQDPDHPPQAATYTARPNWGRYPILFDKAQKW